jgi:prepilin-type N-terminal cleavage/methylation domain-containing protein
MLFAMRTARKMKAGYTLVEVLVVVSIMGILSSIGVAGLQRAVANARIKDAARNTAAFVERVSALAAQRNEVLCLKVFDSDLQQIVVYRDTIERNCSQPKGKIDSLRIDSPAKFVPSGEGCPTTMKSWINDDLSPSSMKAFDPHRYIGLSSMPLSGGICIRYGTMNIYGAASNDKNIRKKNVKKVIPMWKVEDDGSQNNNWNNWTEL